MITAEAEAKPVIDLQEEARQLVRNEVYCNVGQFMDYCIKKSFEESNDNNPIQEGDVDFYVDPSDWNQAKLNAYLTDELSTTWEDVTGEEWVAEEDLDEEGEEYDTYTLDKVRDYIRDNASPIEVYEWWAVSDWFGGRLKEHDHMVINVGMLTVWGRTTTGQAIYLDGVVEAITEARLKARGDL